MGERWRKFKERWKEDRQLRQRFYMGFLLVVVCCLLIGVLAKYIYEKMTGISQITADKFYFTADLLGDTKMVSSEGSEETTYSFGEKSTEGRWYLYGANNHDIEIQVQNYFDELRVTKQDIQYNGSISIQDANGNEITKSSQTNGPELKNGNETFTKGTLTTSQSGQSQKITVSIPSHADWNYKDGTTVIVKIASTSPYKKTLTMKFILYATDTTMKYQINDSTGSPYAELILMTNVNTDIMPYLVWSKELEIDNTNPLTFHYENGQFTQQSGMTSRNMQISKSLQTGRSETIYFFKSDTSKNYSKKETTVNPENNQYTINIGQ